MTRRSALLAVGAVLMATIGAESASGADAGSWETMKLPVDPAFETSDAASVLPLGENDVWAFGCESINGILGENCFAMHWDGKSWQQAADFPPQLWGLNVSASSPTDIWVGGIAEKEGSGDPRTAGIAHFDGKSWSYEDLTQHTNLVHDIEVHAPGDVWWFGGCCGYPVLLGRSGEKGWQTHELKDEYNSGSLDVLNPDDVWATVPVFVGGRTTDIGVLRGNPQDGMKKVATLRQADFDYDTGIVARSENDVWVHGYSSDTEDGPAKPLIQHWDGAEWTATTPPSEHGEVVDVFARGDEVWAAGGGTESWLARWDPGTTSWQESVPSLKGYGVRGASVVPGGSTIWSVGVQDGHMVAARYTPK